MANGTKHALALAMALPLAACVLVVPAPNDDLGSTCSLTAKESDTTCGRCVETSCQEPLDDCCRAGDACEPILHDLVTCAVYETCAAPGRGRVELELRACVARACTSSCNVDQYAVDVEDGPSTADGRVCRESGAGCVCQVDANADSSGPRCPTAVPDAWLCCASADYPDPGESCACTPLECKDQDGYCACTVADASSLGTTTSSCTAPSGTCCESDSLCSCDDSRDECPSGSTLVTVCSTSRFACGGSSRQVERCDAN